MTRTRLASRPGFRPWPRALHASHTTNFATKGLPVVPCSDPIDLGSTPQILGSHGMPSFGANAADNATEPGKPGPAPLLSPLHPKLRGWPARSPCVLPVVSRAKQAFSRLSASLCKPLRRSSYTRGLVGEVRSLPKQVPGRPARLSNMLTHQPASQQKNHTGVDQAASVCNAHTARGWWRTLTKCA